ncbi:MBL fold metallo-hydrolase [Streptomyces sp. FXJ1.172]|uniref:MBL fold metallo-hydrolase n=1 Tax=Streptomyces sp. FXJ1.172 TaxID=710705 RepID=UPI0007CF2440|nr:MBL fold metallo-hydrolase [Streptomyces sp. FXJ1.172]WEO97353.1 MBL fold metallo-hydrolase [Streptomyces sp. FXJ1.172]
MFQTKVIAIPVLGKHSVNAYLLLGRQPIVVDAGTPGSAQLIYDQIASHGVNPQDIHLIVVTHGHVDHFGSAAELSRLTGAPIAGTSPISAPTERAGPVSPYLPIGLFGRLLVRSARVRETTEPFGPDLLIRGATRLSDLGVEARIMPTPGHTAGSVSVLTDHGDLVAGDLVATPFLGFGKRPANPPFHDDRLGNLASLREMLALAPTKLHVGHGAPLNPEQVGLWAAAEQRRLDRLAVRGRLRTKSEPAA